MIFLYLIIIIYFLYAISLITLLVICNPTIIIAISLIGLSLNTQK
jgi:hypothetical protein